MARVMVVENDAPLLFLLNEVLHRDGWEVVCTRRADNALSMLLEHRPDILLLDLGLDGPIPGWDLLRYLKDEPSTSDVPIVVCTGMPSFTRQQTSWLRERNVPVIRKPFELEELEHLIESMVGGPAALHQTSDQAR